MHSANGGLQREERGEGGRAGGAEGIGARDDCTGRVDVDGAQESH